MKTPMNNPSSSLMWWPNRMLGLAVGLVCSAWVFFLHIYLPPANPIIPWGMVLLAFGLLVWRAHLVMESAWIPAFPAGTTSRRGMTKVGSWVPFGGLAACATALIIFPYPYNIGVVFLGLAWGASLLIKADKPAGTPTLIKSALVQTGLLLTISAVILPLVFAWAARVHQFAGPGQLLAYPIGWLLKLFGQPVEFISGGTLFIRTFEDSWPFTITAEKLLPVPMVLFAIIWSGILVIRRRQNRFETLGMFWLVLLVFSLLRLTILILSLLQRNNLSYFWDPWVMTLSVLALGIIFRERGTGNREQRTENRDPKTENRKPKTEHRTLKIPSFVGNDVIAWMLGFATGAAILAGLTFRDPGTPKSGRIMINEHGSDWEWTTDTLNTETYSEITTYNYYCLARYLEYYYDLHTNDEPLSPAVLQNLDVLILKIPTEPYSPAEIQAVVDYVRQGGSLWVIGDHTNVFGSSSFFNPLLRRFGYSLKYVSTHDMKSGNLSLYEKPKRFAHPSVINLPTYLFATSCSMTAPWTADAAILGYGLRADHLDYSQKNFFADRTRNQFNIEFGLMLQQAAGKYGKGRILVTTDSTPFSNFFIFIKGKPELALGTMNWLNRSPKLAWLNPFLLILGLAGLVIIVVLRFWSGALLAGVILGMALAGFITDGAARRAYPLPKPDRPVPWINFEREHSSYFLPVLRLVKDGDPDYLTFYVWTQRVGAVPREMDDFDQTISGTDPVVMIDPATALDAQETANLRSYLERGGRLLVINSVQNRSDAAARLLEAYGIRLTTQESPSDTLHALTLEGRFFPLAVKGKFASLSGGEIFFQSNQGEAIGVTKTVGQGKIWALSCGHLFRNTSMGQTSMVPDDGMRALFEVEFRVIRQMLGKE